MPDSWSYANILLFLIFNSILIWIMTKYYKLILLLENVYILEIYQIYFHEAYF